MSSFWTAEEIDLSDDAMHWAAPSDDERHFVSHVLAFAASDGSSSRTSSSASAATCSCPRRAASTASRSRWRTSIETYALLIDAYVKAPAERERLLRAIETVPCVKAKAEWALKWIVDATFGECLVAFAVVEGIFFSGSFCALFWLKKRGLMPGSPSRTS